MFVPPVTALPGLCFPLLPISKALLWNWAALPFKTSNTQLADFVRNMLYCSYPPKHSKKYFLLLIPATFSVKVIVSGQSTERASFSDSIFFYTALINIRLLWSQRACIWNILLRLAIFLGILCKQSFFLWSWIWKHW